MAGHKSNYAYWGSLPFYRDDGRRSRHRIDYERIVLPDSRYVDNDWTFNACSHWDPKIRLAARKRMWRRIRSGYYDDDKHPRVAHSWEHWLPQPERQSCGARTRNGKPCRNKVVNSPLTGKPSNRCRMHGGYSSGPRTAEGKAASLAALARGREISIARRSIHHKVKSHEGETP